MLKFGLYALLSIAVLLGCDGKGNEAVDCSVMNHEGVELVYPKGTESFTVGDNVTIKWKVDPDKVSMVRVVVSTTSQDGPFKDVFSKGISASPDEGKQCADTIWTVGDEYSGIDVANKTVYLRVESYTDATTYHDVSGMITISQ